MNIISLLSSLNKKDLTFIEHRLKCEQQNALLEFMFDVLTLMKQNKTHEIKQIRNFKVKQHRLYKKIVNELANQPSQQSIESQLLKVFTEVDFLYRKNLFDLAQKHLHTGKKILQNFPSPYYQLLFHRWESILRKETPKNVKEDLKFLDTNKQTELNLLKQKALSSLEIRYATYHNLLLSRHRLEGETIIETQHINKLMNVNNLSGEDYILACNNNAIIYFYQQKYNAALSVYQQLTNYIESFKKPEYTFRNEYFMALNNLMLIQSTAENYYQVNLLKEKIYRLYGSDKSFELQFFRITQNYLLSIYCEIKDLHQGKIISSEIEKKLPILKNKLPIVHLFFLYYNLALMAFYLKQPKHSLKFCTLLMYNSDKKGNIYLSNLFYYSHFLYIINHYTLSNYSIIQKQKYSIKYDLDQIKSMSTYDTLFFETLTHQPTKLSNDKLKETLQQLKEIRTKQSQPPIINRFINIEDWLAEQLSD